MKLDILLTDSLQKIFADEEFSFPEYTAGSALKCEVFSFQITCRCDDYADIEINSDSDLEVICREVLSVPCEVPAFDSSENPFVLPNTPGFYPDALMPLQNSMKVSPRQWKSFWITVKTKDDTPAGIHNIDFKLTAHSTRNSYTDTKECRFELEVLPHKQPDFCKILSSHSIASLFVAKTVMIIIFSDFSTLFGLTKRINGVYYI